MTCTIPKAGKLFGPLFVVLIIATAVGVAGCTASRGPPGNEDVREGLVIGVGNGSYTIWDGVNTTDILANSLPQVGDKVRVTVRIEMVPTQVIVAPPSSVISDPSTQPGNTGPVPTAVIKNVTVRTYREIRRGPSNITIPPMTLPPINP
jgi:hypothetical protein